MTYTVVHRTPLDAAGLKVELTSRLPLADGLFWTAASSASVESRALESPFPFDDLVGSWNGDVPAGASLEMQAGVRLEDGWSEWFSLGRSEGGRYFSAPRQEGPAGFVEIDTLKLKRPATAFRYRILIKTDKKKPVRLRLAAVTVSDGRAAPLPAFRPGPWRTELRTAARSQMEEQEKYKHDICSPTSLAMALEFWGRRAATIELAERVRDQTTGIFGHWPFNAAVAGSAGLEAWVARLESLEDLQAEIAQGRPVVVSVTFAEGELAGAPIKKSKGHIMLVVGFTAKGDVIALDPAAPDRKGVRRVYDRAQFHKAWRLNKRGLAYLMGPLKGRRLTVGVPVTALMAAPRQKGKMTLDDPEHLSQLLYGESVVIDELRGDWAKVRAEEQSDYFEGGLWQGYPGWVRGDALTLAGAPSANCVVRTREAIVQRGADLIALSVGTRLNRVAQDKGFSTVRLIDGALGEVASDALYEPPAKVTLESRSQIVKTAELFLGTSYYWGGRSGVQSDPSVGVDCSGLVSLAYRIHGLDLPRDSHEQKLKSRALKSREMKPADLVFLSESDKDRRITHVMIYTGGDGVIESRKSSGRVLRSSFKERFGRTLHELKSGGVVTDLSFPKPRRRLIYFGTYF